MNQQEKEQLIKEIFSDEEYVKGLLALETPEEVQASLKEEGLEITVEEIIKIKDLLVKMNDGEMSDEELSDEDLESVSGGILGMVIIAGVGLGGMILGLATWDAVRRRW